MHLEFQLLRRKVQTSRIHFFKMFKSALDVLNFQNQNVIFQLFDVDMMTTFLSIFGNDETHKNINGVHVISSNEQ